MCGFSPCINSLAQAYRSVHDSSSDWRLFFFFSSFARILGQGFTIHSLPALFFFSSGDQLAHTNFTFKPGSVRIVAQRAETTVAECFQASCV